MASHSVLHIHKPHQHMEVELSIDMRHQVHQDIIFILELAETVLPLVVTYSYVQSNSYVYSNITSLQLFK
jgi:hypothetical protein